MLLLMVVSVAYTPLVLPVVLESTRVDAWAVARMLSTQLLLPIIVGMLLARFLPALVRPLQPWVAKGGTWSLYAVMATTLVGFIQSLWPIITSGAIVPGILFVIGAFAIGYYGGRFASRGADHLEDIGGLGTAQRNTAAAMVIATQNFEDPAIVVTLTLINVLGLFLLMAVARRLSRDSAPATPCPGLSRQSP